MRHLLSPVIHPRYAAVREELLSLAETASESAQWHELQFQALIKAQNDAMRRKGRRHGKLALQLREGARQAISKACDLTDYSDPLDRAPEPWVQRLADLAAEAKERALSPNQLNYVASNPYKSYAI